MNYEDRIVCFLDILGFRAHILSTITSDGNDSSKGIEHLASTLSGIRDILDVGRPQDRPDKEVTQFSDSIVISFLSTQESGVFYAILDILWVQINLVLRGLLFRGGIVRGKLVHTPELLFGPAMIDAYLLESKAALYPRVVLDESIINAGIEAHGRHHLPEHEARSIMSLVKQDADGMYYIDYVTAAQSELDDPEIDYPCYLDALSRIILDGLKTQGNSRRTQDPSVTIKYRWLKEKLRPHLVDVKRNAAQHYPEDDELRHAYACIPDL